MEENNIKSKKIETYTDDMAQAIRDDRTGLIKKIINEEEKNEAEKINLSPDSRRNKTFVLLGVILLLASFMIIVFLFFFKEEINTVSIEPKYSAYIFSDKSGFKDSTNLDKNKLTSLIYNTAYNTEVEKGKIESFYITENNNIIGFRAFVSKMETSIFPEYISRVFDDNFLLGVFNSGERKDPFILLKNNSFQDVFVLMKSWENKMLYDLHGIIGLELSTETNYLFTKDFEDGVIANKNARVLYGEDGQIILMYVFFDNSFVIITDSISATNEIVARLSSSQIKK